MTLRSEIEEIFNQAQAQIAAASTPHGLPRETGLDIRFVTINANNQAFAEALMKIADRLDTMESDSVA
ncbi:hypothetical protein ITJ66_05870 [Plantibacter sp. VKM Ac-2885]|uniref:hypothetical protein n=1 Tax=Plantibacter sp. VKM Ac-2885 TaxID=2783828 RepID=UPI00188CF152|nr:hypothetical protein [Plantibacter sp. VKM Ac-2885]MBF4512012.1 hypothetical protein [Plantibacter sp. VKM Ac-2885]